MSNNHLDEKIKCAEDRISELKLLIKHWNEARTTEVDEAEVLQEKLKYC